MILIRFISIQMADTVRIGDLDLVAFSLENVCSLVKKNPSLLRYNSIDVAFQLMALHQYGRQGVNGVSADHWYQQSIQHKFNPNVDIYSPTDLEKALLAYALVHIVAGGQWGLYRLYVNDLTSIVIVGIYKGSLAIVASKHILDALKVQDIQSYLKICDPVFVVIQDRSDIHPHASYDPDTVYTYLDILDIDSKVNDIYGKMIRPQSPFVSIALSAPESKYLIASTIKNKTFRAWKYMLNTFPPYDCV